MSDAAKLFLKIVGTESGEIKGEVEIAGYVGQIGIDDWSWEMKRETPPGEGSKAEVVPSPLSISKLMDRATTGMLAALRSGDLLTCTITLIETASDQFSMVMTLKEARLQDYSMEVKSQEKGGLVEETWTLDYREITVDHQSGRKGGTSSYKIDRPAWCSQEPPKGSGGKTEEFFKLSQEIEPGNLETLWEERIKPDIQKRKNNPSGKKDDKAGEKTLSK